MGTAYRVKPGARVDSKTYLSDDKYNYAFRDGTPLAAEHV